MIYFDNAATTRVTPEAAQTVFKYLTEKYYNPSAMYHEALDVKNDLENARSVILNQIGGEGKLYFTSGGTESDNLAFFGTKKKRNSRVIISAVEHAAVYQSAMSLKQAGFDVCVAPVDGSGKIDAEAFSELLNADTSFVSVIHVSNETGAVNDIGELARLTKRVAPRALFHSDGVQAGGKIKIDLKSIPVDLYSLSAHKIGAPKGTGALYAAKGVHLNPIIVGGGQEDGVRSSTENTAGIMAFATAFAAAVPLIEKSAERLRAIAAYLRKRLGAFDDVMVISPEDGSPYILSFASASVRGEVIEHALEREGVLVGTGSACSSNKSTRRIPEALNLQGKFASGMVRLSFSRFSSMAEAEEFADKFEKVYKELKRHVG